MIDYKKMTNDEKREIFSNCCLGILRDEDYILVKDFMCSNLRYYKEFYEEWRDAGYRVEKVRITPILIKLMNMVIKDNDYVIVEKLPELLLKYHVLTERHIDFMNLLMDPASVYRKNKNYFYESFADLCRYVNSMDQVDKEEYPFKIVDYLNKYREYCNKTKILKKEGQDNLDFIHYGYMVLGYCYLNDVPVERLDEIFNYLIDDHSVIDDYLELNNHSSKFHELTYNLTEKLVRSAIWEEPVIK